MSTPSSPMPYPGTNAPNPQGFPSHKQLLLPLMTVLDRAGGAMKPLDAIAAVADYLGIPPAMRDMAVPSGRGKWEGRKRYVFKNRVMWTRFEAVERAYIDKTCRGRWKLTDKAREDLVNVRPGFVFKVYETPNGTALWATAEAAAGLVSNESVNLVFTSPEYALVRAKKYGNIRGADFVQWLVNHGRDWRRALVEDGSVILNLGHAWSPGEPTLSEYQERVLLAFIDELKFHYAQRLTWYNPCAMPRTPWVTHQRVRLNCADQVLYWLGKTATPYADANAVLRKFSAEHRRRLARKSFPKQGEPSSSQPRARGSNRFRGTGGAIAHSVLRFGNSNSADPYLKRCAAVGIEPHGARMPYKLADFMIRLTTRPGDVVWDPFCGSNIVGYAAEQLGRRWLAGDISLTYAAGSALRFPSESVALEDVGYDALVSVGE